MAQRHYTGLEFIEGFSLFAGALWITGALLVGGIVMHSSTHQGTVDPASNVTPVGESVETQ